ncbi:hypothetical protein EDB84DRAFT_141626 [Lactarius hengduanensis]|nr:hypothetical protein EDB84DRAFT_141626 [Lactarius hengduanensis]
MWWSRGLVWRTTMVAGWCGAMAVSVGSWLASVVMHCCPAALQGKREEKKEKTLTTTCEAWVGRCSRVMVEAGE